MVGLTRFQNKEMTGLSFGTQKSGRDNGVELCSDTYGRINEVIK